MGSNPTLSVFFFAGEIPPHKKTAPMPYRAMLWTMLTIGLALLAVGLWIRAVEPQLATAIAATQSAPPATTSTRTAKIQPGADEKVRAIMKITLICSFILMCLLFTLGLFGTFREWLRFQTLRTLEKKPEKTHYTDAWKIAGQRLNPSEPPQDQSGPPDPPAQ